LLDRGRDKLFQAWPPERHRLQALAARNVAFIESVLEVTDKHVFVDTSKSSNRLRLIALQRFSTFDVRAIHLVRDVRGVVASQARRRKLDVRQAARRWVKWHCKLEGNLKYLPAEKQLRIRYEDLCQDVPGTLAQLFRFCGVEPPVELPDFRITPHHIVGNPMRLKSVSEIRLDERWKQVFSYEQLKQINQVAGPLREQYGYR
ncbi:MAG: sulfotransferase, partial [Reinekea sp.]|nr:sulfotransferase [Reinekea sp.]